MHGSGRHNHKHKNKWGLVKEKSLHPSYGVKGGYHTTKAHGVEVGTSEKEIKAHKAREVPASSKSPPGSPDTGGDSPLRAHKEKGIDKSQLMDTGITLQRKAAPRARC